MQPDKISRRTLLRVMGAAPLAAAPGTVANVVEYPLYRAKGTHRELGRQHGEQAAEHIRRHLDVICKGSKLSRAGLRTRAAAFQPMFHRYCPHLLEEMTGLAEGAGVTNEEAMACSIRGEIGNAKQGCTAYVIGRERTVERAIIAGQNSDMTNEILPLAYVLHLQPREKPEVLMWTFGGMLGYHGMNSAGVAHFANALGGGPKSKFAMPHYPLKRMMFECTTLDQVVELFRRVPLASNGNYVVCDAKGILDVEATTAGPELIRDEGAGFIAHTNHFLCSRYAVKENFDRSWKDSFPRIEKMNALIKSRPDGVSVDDIKSFLRDHSGSPTGICRHDGDSRTVASLIAAHACRRGVSMREPIQDVLDVREP
jgi:isopenicillin-N N-acyltransferase-like protein